MKQAPTGHLALAPHRAAQSRNPLTHVLKENSMSSRKNPSVVRKPSKKIADSRRVRFGGGSVPRILRAQDAATRDSRAIRFGGGSVPASLRK
jgi:hypothetical protein